jgi:Tol biopolymer transport system component
MFPDWKKQTLVCWLVMNMLISCVPRIITNTSNGFNLIAPLGTPPADSIVWSPIDEKMILVTASDVGHGRAEVYMLNLETGKKQILAKVKYGDFISATWSSNGKYVLLLVRDNSEGFDKGGLWILDIDKSKLEYFLDSGYGTWSPDGNKIATFALESNSTNSEKITLRLIDVATKAEQLIYTNDVLNMFWGLSWSSNSQNLILAMGRDNPGDLYKLNLDTVEVTQLTKNERNTLPAWSPKGNIIAYTNWPSDGIKSTLNLIKSDGSCEMRIPVIDTVFSPTWSPDGEKLGYIGENGIYFLEVNKVFNKDIYQDLCNQ